MQLIRPLQKRSRTKAVKETKLRGIVFDMLGLTIPALLVKSAESASKNPFVQFEEYTVSYAEFDERVRRVAGGVQALGLHHGGRVGLALPNCLKIVCLTPLERQTYNAPMSRAGGWRWL